MPRFAANLSFLWTELPFLDRFEAAARAGFTGVEFHFPYDVDPIEVRARLDASGLTPVLINIRGGDAAAKEMGLACLPGREADFRMAVAECIHYAQRIGVPRANCLAGKVPEGADRDECEAVFLSNLKFAGESFRRAGLKLMVEPINSRDVPRFLLNTSAQTVAMLDRVGLDNVFLQYDFYHMQIMEGDLARTVETLLPRIGHIQFADNPDRHEPGSGEINFPFLFAHLDAIGYREWASAEYRPSGRTEDSLGWFAVDEK
jgi:hydroxypyruvate isomerase